MYWLLLPFLICNVLFLYTCKKQPLFYRDRKPTDRLNIVFSFFVCNVPFSGCSQKHQLRSEKDIDNFQAPMKKLYIMRQMKSNWKTNQVKLSLFVQEYYFSTCERNISTFLPGQKKITETFMLGQSNNWKTDHYFISFDV